MNYVKTITDSSHISSFFRNITRRHDLPVSIRQNEMEYNGELTVDRKNREIRIKMAADRPEPNDVTVYMNINEVMFSFQGKLDYSGQNITLQSPSELQISFDRMLPRLKIPTESGARFITADGFQGPIADISTQGLAFYSTQSEPPHSFINSFILLDGQKIYVDADVRYIKRVDRDYYRIGLEFQNSGLAWQDFIKIYQYTTKHLHPHIQPLQKFSKKLIYNLYKESGYFALKPGKEIQERFFDMMQSLSIIGDKPSIGQSYAISDDSKLIVTGSVLRIYNNTFLGHQLASLPRAKYLLELYFSLSDFILNNKYFHYYISYFNDNETWHQKMFYAIGQLINRPSLFIYDRLHHYELKIFEEHPLNQEFMMEIERPDMEFKRVLPHLEMNVYDYNAGRFDLNTISQIYETIGLYLKRKCWKVIYNNQIAAYVIAEVYSNGLSIYNLMDMCRVYFVNNQNVPEILKIIIPKIRQFYHRYSKERIRFIFKCPNQLLESIQIPDLEYQSEMGRVMANRTGFAEYKKILYLKLLSQ